MNNVHSLERYQKYAYYAINNNLRQKSNYMAMQILNYITEFA